MPFMGDETTPGQELTEMIPPDACMDKPEGRRLRSSLSSLVKLV